MIPNITFLFVFIFSLLFPISRTGFVFQTTDSLEQEALVFIEQLAQGQYAEAAAAFDEPMRAALSVKDLQSIWEDLNHKFGAFQSTGTTKIQTVGQYTAVIVETNFDRAVINLRVVFNSTGQISGFFYSPLRLSGSISTWLITAVGFTALFAILYPILLAIFARRRLGVPWRYFVFGMGIFLIFQLVTRIPLISIIEGVFGQQIRASRALTVGWLLVLCFSAGLFEETGRYIGYRWMM
ncbi:MAG: DUF3887 domain-containing protein, partial [Anaerolineaceae bacterium]|nr:DUF3887 domain-containing protein [Anaerolineaceae bacterium]